jgi:hypothetical protein
MASVVESDVRLYGSANMPDVDGATVGGAISFSKEIFFSDLLANGTVNYVSESASDTAVVITTSGRDATGVIVTEAKTLTGVTPVAGTQTFERLLKGVVTGTAAVLNVAVISNTKVISAHTAVAGAAASGSQAASITLQSGDGASVALGQLVRITNNSPAGVQNQIRRIIRIAGDVCFVDEAWSTVPTSATTYDVHIGMKFRKAPNQVTEVRRAFYNAASDVPGGSSRTYYEKCFLNNDNTTTALTVATVTKQLDPSSGTLQIAVCKALNDSQTAINRQTLPTNGDASALTFTSGAAPQSQNVPSPQNLPASAGAGNGNGAEGVWLSLTLTAGLAAAKTSFDIRAQGQST